MIKFNDLTGKKFNKLLVIERDISKAKDGSIMWKCLCDCGNYKILPSTLLKNGKIKSCGCLPKSFEDLTGQRFGRLTASERDEHREKDNRIRWICQCDCGNKKSVSAVCLKSGTVKSCGCLAREGIDITNKKFGRWTVIEKDDCRNKHGAIMWNCICDCGNVGLISTSSLIHGVSKSCGCFKKDVLSEVYANRLIDISGKKFGKLTAVKRANKSDTHCAKWICLCDCGNEIVAGGRDLRIGHTLSCGCLQKEVTKNMGYNNSYDLIGKTFGKLTVINRVAGNKFKKAKWLCKCECGAFTEVECSNLMSGHTVSCGCIRSASELKIANILNSHNIHTIKEYSFLDLRSEIDISLRFDFAVFDNGLKCLIEYDGEQHYNQDHFYYCDDVPLHDNKKNNYCKDNNIPLYRIRFDQNLEEELDKILIKENLIKNSVKSA